MELSFFQQKCFYVRKGVETSSGKEHQFFSSIILYHSSSLWQEDIAVAIIDVLRYYALAIMVCSCDN